MITTLSYLGAHWSLFIAVVLAVVGLGAASWFLKNWRYALCAVVIAIAGFAYQASNIDGYKRKAAEDAQAQIQVLQRRLGALQITQAIDAQHATADTYLNSQLDALSRETPRNDSACLDIDAARRVRAIDATALPDKSVAATVPSRRPSSLLPWRLRRP